MATLLELAKLSRSLNDMLESTGGELTPEIEESLQLTKENLPFKIDAYYFQIEDFKRRSDTFLKIREEAERCMKLYDRLIDNLETRMKLALETMGQTQMTGEYSKFSLVRTKPKVEVNLTELDEQYMKTKTERYVDKLKIYDEMKQGIKVQGATLVENTYLKMDGHSMRTIK